jgi:cytoskeleton protein RodZ
VAQGKTEPIDAPRKGGKGAAPREPSLGSFLIEARKQRGLSADEVVQQTRLPAHYVRMIENDDYKLIADQLYLLPFLRRYADFLGLDSEEVATRFIREVQRADGNASRMSEPMPVIESGRRRWIIPLAAAVTVAAIAVVGYFAVQRWYRRPAAPTPSGPSTASETIPGSPAASGATQPEGSAPPISVAPQAPQNPDAASAP